MNYYNNHKLPFIGLLTLILIMIGMFSLTGGIAQSPFLTVRPVMAAGTVATDPNLKIAFIGDTGIGTNAEKVMTLIKNEGASAVFHQGDFDYTNSPSAFESHLQKTVPTTLPYFGSVGNHDDNNWTSPNGGYQASFIKRSGSYCTGDVGNLAACTYKGLFALELGIGTTTGKDDATQVNYIKNQLAASNAMWKICSWHKLQNAMQVGAKSDEIGWQAYEACRAAGAIIITAHEHTYHRTKTLTNMQNQTIDSTCNDPAKECVAPGKTFAVVSGLGGKDHSRSQVRCLPTTFPYGCNGVWSSIYTSSQSAQDGALFIVFNYQGNPSKAHGYFKNVSNQIIDQFDITLESGSVTPPPTTNTPTPTQSQSTITPTPTKTTPTPTSPTITQSAVCATKKNGDSDCNGKTDLIDFNIFRGEFFGGCSDSNLSGCGANEDNQGNAMDANYNYVGSGQATTDTQVSLLDFEIFRKGFYAGGTVTPTITATNTITITQSFTPTPSSTKPTPTIPSVSSNTGIWISSTEIKALPTTTTSWNDMKSVADKTFDDALLYYQDSHHPQQVLAAALVYAKTGTSSYATKVKTELLKIAAYTGARSGGLEDGRSLALGRNLAAYVISADVIKLSALDSAADQKFRTFLTNVRKWQNSEGRTLITCHEERPNNWGTMCGASRIAADIYLKDSTDLDRAVKIYKGFIGDRTSYSGFQWEDPLVYTWMCDTNNPRPVNPVGCVKSGHDLSGAVVDDVRRGGSFAWPPTDTLYSWGGYSALLAQAEMLKRAGYDSYNWESQAILRGMKFISTNMADSASYAVDWVPYVINKQYNSSYPTASTRQGYGRLLDWTAWTHAK